MYFAQKYSYLAINTNLKQIIFLQRQIRKYLSFKKNKNKVFYRPQDNKPKNNYLFLNTTNGGTNESKINYLNDSQNLNLKERVKENDSESKNEKSLENERTNMYKDDDSFLNNEIKYVENLRIQNAVYTGQVLNGKRHGKGTQVWDDGAKYEGSWENDKSNGYGTFYHTDGDVYQGYWKNNRANGKGVYISSDGGRYEGEWIDDVQNGFGTEKWNDGSSYKGNYIMGKKEGYGEYDNNLKQGKGKYFWADGKIYLGQFNKDKKEGIGKYTWKDGRVYLGFWKSGKQNGLGRYTNPNEKKDKFGIWENGKRTQWLDEEELKNEDNELNNEYQYIINFDTTFNDNDLDEEKIILKI